MTTISFDEHILNAFEEKFPIPDDATPLYVYTTGYHDGLKAGQALASEFIETTKDKARLKGIDQGYPQGIAYGAYIASHTSTIDIDAAMTPAQAAASMRESITAAIEIAANNAKERAEAKG